MNEMSHYENVTINQVYQKLEYLQKKVDEIETLLLLPEEKLSEKELKEFKEARKQIIKEGGISLEELGKRRKAH